MKKTFSRPGHLRPAILEEEKEAGRQRRSHARPAVWGRLRQDSLFMFVLGQSPQIFFVYMFHVCLCLLCFFMFLYICLRLFTFVCVCLGLLVILYVFHLILSSTSFPAFLLFKFFLHSLFNSEGTGPFFSAQAGDVFPAAFLRFQADCPSAASHGVLFNLRRSTAIGAGPVLRRKPSLF